jgi:UDP-N-acetylmuramyl pentapeptide phosphotransferase/UDP-N-acetylglucosamine-1-phosphate transferase
MAWLSPALLALIVFILTWLATGAVLALAKRRAMLALPNERSSHTVPTPQGAGLALVPVLAVSWLVIGFLKADTPLQIDVIVIAMIFLALISLWDDLRTLNVAVRLAAQILAVTAALWVMPFRGPFFAGLLAPSLDLFAAAVLWVWFINLFNFMDGIDGIAGVQTISLGGGIAVTALLAGADPALPWFGMTVLAAAFGFLWWNWQPAKIFLGDTGSVPLGFVLGWLLLTLAAEGQWAAALILPLYYLADATLTLIRRALRGEKIWRAHREHFYQRATQRGLSHAHVSSAVLVGNLCLIGLAAWAATGRTWQPLLGAAAVTVLLLLYLSAGPTGRGDDT